MFNLNGKVLVALLAGCGATAALAQTQSSETMQQQPAQTTQEQGMTQAGVDKASEVIGKSVRDSQGQELGQVEDLAIDVQKGELAYVAITSAEGRMVGVPADQLQTDPQQEGFTSSLSQQELASAQELPEENWPAEPTVGGTQMGMSQPSDTQQTADSGIKRASELMGQNVKDSQGEDLGEIDDFALDMQQGELAYVVLSTGGMFQRKLVGVPATALQVDPQTQEYVASVSQQQIEQAQELPDENWPQQPTVAAAGTGTAQGGEVHDFASLDQNGDGYISQTEAQSAEQLSQQFDQLDQDADQQIDRTEFAAFQETGTQPTEQQPMEQQPMEQQPMEEQPMEEQPMDEEWEQTGTEQDY